MKKELLEWLTAIGIALVVVFLLFRFVLMTVIIDGSSMSPTLRNKDRVIAWQLWYTPKQGDMVILSENTGLGKVLVKRVVATEGQTVDIDINGIVLVDGEALDEDFEAVRPSRMGDHDYPVTVPENCVFVMGDNRNDSTDSRSNAVGFVEEDEVLGKVFLRLLPIGELGFVR